MCKQQSYKKNFSAFQSNLCGISTPETASKLNSQLLFRGQFSFECVFIYLLLGQNDPALSPQPSSAGQPNIRSELKKSFFFFLLKKEAPSPACISEVAITYPAKVKLRNLHVIY